MISFLYPDGSKLIVCALEGGDSAVFSNRATRSTSCHKQGSLA